MKTETFRQGTIEASKTLSKHSGVKVIFEGSQAHTNGDEIVIPSLPSGKEIPADVVQALRGYTDHETSHVQYTDCKGIASWFKNYSDEKGKEQATNLNLIWQTLEDVRIERKRIRDLPGSWKNLKGARQACLDKFELPSEVDNPVLPLCWAALDRHSQDYNMEAKLESLYDDQKKALADSISDQVDKCNSSWDVLDLAEKLLEEPEADEAPEPKPHPDEEEYGGKESGQGESTEGEGDQLTEEEKELQEEFAEAASKAGIGSMSDTVDKLLEECEKKWKNDGVKSQRPYRVLSTRLDSYSNPDYFEKYIYSKKIPYSELVSSMSREISVIQGKFRRALLSMENRGWDRGQQVGRLDPSRFKNAITGAGLYRKKREELEDYSTALTLLIDCSGSMAISPQLTAGKVAISLVEATKGTPVKCRVLGHTSEMASHTKTPDGWYKFVKANRKDDNYWSRAGSLEMINFKEFEESYHTAKPRLEESARASLGSNADYDAIEFCFHELKKRQEKRKVLIVISDGAPSVRDWNWSRNDTKRCMRELQEEHRKKFGIETYGIGIDSESVHEFYDNAINVSDIEEFAGKSLEVFTKAVFNRSNA